MYIDDAIDEFISRRFEDVSAQFFIRSIKEKKIKGVYDVGSYWYDNPETKTNGEFDVVLKRKNGYDFYECKYYSDEMTLKECEEEADKVRRIKGIDYNKIGFVSLSGFDFKSEEYDLIVGDDLYSVN